MIADRTTILPSREDMLKRLVEVVNDPGLRQGLYPVMLDELAGQQMNALEVVMLVQVAVCDYVQDMSPPMGALLNRQIPGFLKAIISEEEVAKEAQDYFKEAIAGNKLRTSLR